MLIGAPGGGGAVRCVVLNGVTKECENKDSVCVCCLELVKARQDPLCSRFLLDTTAIGVTHTDGDNEMLNCVTKKYENNDSVCYLELIKSCQDPLCSRLVLDPEVKDTDVDYEVLNVVTKEYENTVSCLEPTKPR